jgi:hypothetical protein
MKKQSQDTRISPDPTSSIGSTINFSTNVKNILWCQRDTCTVHLSFYMYSTLDVQSAGPISPTGKLKQGFVSD